MTDLSVLDAAGRRRSPATLPGYHAGRPPHNKGMRYPADPPTIDEIVAVMRHTSDDRHGWRVRAMIVGPLARRPAHPGSARARRARPRSSPRIDPRPQRQGRPPTRSRDGRVGLGTAPPVAERTRRASGRTAVLHHRRLDPRATMVGRCRPLRVPPACRSRRDQAPLCAAPAPARACARARPRARAAEHHPAPTRSRQPRRRSVWRRSPWNR
jgi:hypothetical protein